VNLRDTNKSANILAILFGNNLERLSFFHCLFEVHRDRLDSFVDVHV